MQGTQHTAITYCTGMFQNAEWEKTVCCINADTGIFLERKIQSDRRERRGIARSTQAFSHGSVLNFISFL